MFGGLGLGLRVYYFRDSFSVLLRAQHYFMLTTFGSVTSALIFISYFEQVRQIRNPYTCYFVNELLKKIIQCIYFSFFLTPRTLCWTLIQRT